MHLFIVDGSGFIHRAKHVYPPGSNVRADGLELSCVHGYCSMLWSFLGQSFDGDRATHMVIAYDGPRSENWRRSISPTYKANRAEPEEQFVQQIPYIRRAGDAFGIRSAKVESFEADDIIASYANAAVRAGWRTTIVTGDKDMLQLMRPDVRVWGTLERRALTVEDCVKKFGVPPHLIADVQSLMGDPVDNIPGLPGVGPKTAAKLILQFGSLDALLERVIEVGGTLGNKIATNLNNIRMARELVTLRHDVPLPASLEALEMKPIEPEPLRVFLRECEFVSIGRRIFSQLGMEQAYGR